MLLAIRSLVSLTGCPRAVATRLPSEGASQSNESLSSSVTGLPTVFVDEEETGRPHIVAIPISIRERTSYSGARKAQQLIRRLDLSTYMFFDHVTRSWHHTRQ
ncbi:hypothetical protein XPA_006794 [Xanthoria parietina]